VFKRSLWFGKANGSQIRNIALGPASKFSLAVAVGVPVICELFRFLGVVFAPFTGGIGAPLIAVAVSFYVCGHLSGKLSRSVFAGTERIASPGTAAYFCLFCALLFPVGVIPNAFVALVLLILFSTPAAVILYPSAAMIGVYLMIPHIAPLDAYAFLSIAIHLLGFYLAHVAVQTGLDGRPFFSSFKVLKPRL
jgi:hypothetical protein